MSQTKARRCPDAAPCTPPSFPSAPKHGLAPNHGPGFLKTTPPPPGCGALPDQGTLHFLGQLQAPTELFAAVGPAERVVAPPVMVGGGRENPRACGREGRGTRRDVRDGSGGCQTDAGPVPTRQVLHLILWASTAPMWPSIWAWRVNSQPPARSIISQAHAPKLVDVRPRVGCRADAGPHAALQQRRRRVHDVYNVDAAFEPILA